MPARKLLPIVVGAVALAVQAHLASASNYQVQWGDTLEGLAGRLGVPVKDLAEANGITDPNHILAGSVLVVPSDGRSATEYLVQKGDTLTGISKKVGIPVAQIATANGLTDPNWVPTGRLLSLPPVGSASATAATAAAAAGAATGSYRVREGDNLSDLAVRFGVDVDDLVEASGIDDPNLIVPGQVITVRRATWQCPVPSGRFVNDYGYVTGSGSKHNGVDLFAARGTPVLAPVGGTVERFPNPSGGNAVFLWGKDGNRYYLAHLDAYGDGGRVSSGEVIGYVGNTGDAATTSPHLHFQIHPDDGPSVNPFPTLVAGCR